MEIQKLVNLKINQQKLSNLKNGEKKSLERKNRWRGAAAEEWT